MPKTNGFSLLRTAEDLLGVRLHALLQGDDLVQLRHRGWPFENLRPATEVDGSMWRRDPVNV